MDENYRNNYVINDKTLEELSREWVKSEKVQKYLRGETPQRGAELLENIRKAKDLSVEFLWKQMTI